MKYIHSVNCPFHLPTGSWKRAIQSYNPLIFSHSYKVNLFDSSPIIVLMILTECFILVRSAMFGATFNLVACVGLPKFLEQRKMVFWIWIVYHQIIVSATAMCNKMASTLCQNGFKITCLFVQKFCTFPTIRFGSNYASI